MKNRIKKIKFKSGSDATQMMTRKLLQNFLRDGKITTTEKRIKIIRSQTEIIVNKAKRNSEADRNFMLSKLADYRVIRLVVDQIAPVFKEKTGGYVRMIKLQPRLTDGAKIARLEWSAPVILQKEEKINVETVKEAKPKVIKTKSVKSPAKKVTAKKTTKK